MPKWATFERQNRPKSAVRLLFQMSIRCNLFYSSLLWVKTVYTDCSLTRIRTAVTPFVVIRLLAFLLNQLDLTNITNFFWVVQLLVFPSCQDLHCAFVLDPTELLRYRLVGFPVQSVKRLFWVTQFLGLVTALLVISIFRFVIPVSSKILAQKPSFIGV